MNPEDVFTPRASKVNEHTYVARPDLEDALKRALRMPKHVVIHGESGSGKSWLFKKVLSELDYHFEVANMGLCGGHGSIGDVLNASIIKSSAKQTVSKRKFGLPVITAALEHEESIVAYSEPFLECLKAVSQRANEKHACLVFDNLERVVSDEKLTEELTGLILLADDDRYSEQNVKILLVGTSNEIRSFVNAASISNTIANRLTEIPEVSRLTEMQSKRLAEKGLFELLQYEFDASENFSKESFFRWLSFHSDRIPQFVQELCLYVAYEAQSGNIVSKTIAHLGAKEWVKSSLVKDVSRVERNLNSNTTRIGRRNQVIYCLGAASRYDVNRADIESLLRENFPTSLKGVTLNVSQILSELASAEHRLIARSPKSGYYRFCDPKFRIVVRWLLSKDEESENLRFRSFDDAIGLWSNIKKDA